MLPEMAVSYGIGFVSSSFLGGLVFLKNKKNKTTRSMQLIQKNLKKKSRMWSFVEANIVEDNEELQKIELEKSQQTFTIILVAGILLSWLGFLFLMILLLSPLTRKEKQILRSDLAKRELEPSEVEQILADF